MTFAKKLDLLMNITNTSNSILARNIALDASFISRLRRGLRTPARNVTYLQSMAEYFARSCRAEYQKTALLGAINDNSATKYSATEPLEVIIYQWLNQHGLPSVPIDEFLDDISSFQFRKNSAGTSIDLGKTDCITVSETEVFYGVQGKKSAVLGFLSLVLKSDTPQTLLLYSDEGLEWMTDDPGFTSKWASMLSQVLQKGNRIKIIHSINRHFEEMAAGIRKWVPLYMTGAIEPYYYPKTRDGLFRRTLFIAPETAAVASSSVGRSTGKEANFLFTDLETVKALMEEYTSILHLCRPLMRISTPGNNRDYLSLLREFEAEITNIIIKADGPSNLTLPPDVLNSIMDRADHGTRKQLLSYQQNRIDTFLINIQEHQVAEIFTLPNLDRIIAGEAAVNFSDLLSPVQLSYTAEEYRRHLQNVIHLLETYDNYSVYLSNSKNLEGIIVYVREDVGVLVVKNSLPPVVFAINQNNMISAFWDYLYLILSNESRRASSRSNTIARLKEILARL